MSTRRTFVALLAFSLLIGGGLTVRAALSEQATLRILSPTADERIDGDAVTVQIEVEGAVLGGRSRNGAYALLTLDDNPAVKSLAPMFRFRNVAAGDHELVVELRRPDGSRFDPEVERRVRFRSEARPQP